MDYSTHNKHLIINRVGEKFTTNEGYDKVLEQIIKKNKLKEKFKDE